MKYRKKRDTLYIKNIYIFADSNFTSNTDCDLFIKPQKVHTMKKTFFLFLLAFTCSCYAQDINEIMKKLHSYSSMEYKNREKVITDLTAEQQYLIGLQYHKNGEKDKMAAETWLTSAAKKGNPDAKQLLNKIYKEEENNENIPYIIDRENFVENLPLERMYLQGTIDKEGNAVMFLKIHSKSDLGLRLNPSGHGISIYDLNENGEFREVNNFIPLKKGRTTTLKIVADTQVGSRYINFVHKHSQRIFIKGPTFDSTIANQ